MNTKSELLWFFKLQYSQNHTGLKFKHTLIDKLPVLKYRFSEGSNWASTDYRITSNAEDINKWFDNYWELRPNSKSIANRGLYEKELQEEILNAYAQVNERWNKQLEKQFEEAFDDKFLGFLSGVKQNRKD